MELPCDSCGSPKTEQMLALHQIICYMWRHITVNSQWDWAMSIHSSRGQPSREGSFAAEWLAEDAFQSSRLIDVYIVTNLNHSTRVNDDEAEASSAHGQAAGTRNNRHTLPLSHTAHRFPLCSLIILLSPSSLCGSHHPSRVFRNALTSTSSLCCALLLPPDVRQQLNEQLRCLDLRIETQVAIVQELQDYFRRRAEVELDYSKSLEKLGKSIQQRHKEQKQK